MYVQLSTLQTRIEPAVALHMGLWFRMRPFILEKRESNARLVRSMDVRLAYMKTSWNQEL